MIVASFFRHARAAAVARGIASCLALLLAAPALALAQVSAAEVPGLRLPRNVIPLGYAPSLTIDPGKAAFDAVIVIDVRIETATDRIWLNARDLQIASATATVAGHGEVARVASLIPGNVDVIGLQFAAPLPAGRATLVMRYTARISDINSEGVFRQQDQDSWYVLTQFEPLDARRAFPCFDEPDMKAPWRLTLRVPERVRAYANMPVASEQSTVAGWRDVTFEPTPPLPSYLVAFAVGDFDVVDGGRAGMKDTPISIIVPKGRSLEAAYAAANTGAILAATERYFGFAYPFAKLDLIAYPKPTFGVAMENPGLVTYGARYLLVRPDELTPGFEQMFTGITAHEIAHMWFGNYVTMAWWNDLWLNESFASWMASLISQELHPEWGRSGWRAVQRTRAMGMDGLPSARHIRQPVVAAGDVQASFDGIAYAKGESILAMFEAWLGPEKFQGGVRRYVAKHAWSNATAEDFFTALAAADEALVPAMRGFVERPGVPVLDVELACGAKTSLVLSQRRFTPAGVAAAEPTRWAFPACFEFGDETSGREVCMLVKDARQVVPLPAAACPQWVVANRSGIGYFLPQLSPALYASLHKASGVLGNGDYVSILGDLNLLVHTGAVTYDVALPLAASVAGSTDPRVVHYSLTMTEDVPPPAIAPENVDRFAVWVRRHYGEQARTLGWLPRPGETADTMRLRQDLLALVTERGADPVQIAEVQRLARLWLQDRSAVAPSVRRVVLQTAAATAGADRAGLFDALVEVVVSGKDANERDDVLKALGSFRDPELLDRALMLGLDSRVNPRDSTVPLQQALKKAATSPGALAWLGRNLDALATRVPRTFQGNWPAWAQAACTDAERAQFVAVFETRAPGLDGGPRAYRAALERIDACIAAATIQRAPLNAFLAAPR
ncbi:MAG: M1 family metallopeptidase [Casimicrobiaceae bacterium]